jgi:hypothetical protein
MENIMTIYLIPFLSTKFLFFAYFSLFHIIGYYVNIGTKSQCAECKGAECQGAKCQGAECLGAECQGAEFRQNINVPTCQTVYHVTVPTSQIVNVKMSTHHIVNVIKCQTVVSSLALT